MPANAAQPAQDVGEMASEDSTVGVQLVDDHEREVLEQLGPPGVVRKNARVHHVWIAEHDLRARADGAARVLGRVTVVGEDTDLLAARRGDGLSQAMQLGKLILGKGLGGKQIQRAARRVIENRVQDRRVVAQGLA